MSEIVYLVVAGLFTVYAVVQSCKATEAGYVGHGILFAALALISFSVMLICAFALSVLIADDMIGAHQ